MDSSLDTSNDDRGVAAPLCPLAGSIAQVEWAERIRLRVNSEFDRVATAFQTVALNQDSVSRAFTKSVIAIVEDIRTDVMRHVNAGYFIHDWQDISDQVRRMIFSDPRYKKLSKNREQNSGQKSTEAAEAASLARQGADPNPGAGPENV